VELSATKMEGAAAPMPPWEC